MYIKQNKPTLTEKNNYSGKISGLNDTIKGNYSSFHNYCNIFEKNLRNDETMKKFEKIIELVMLLKESKDMLKKHLETEFGGYTRQ
jgi:hypothetical protein